MARMVGVSAGPLALLALLALGTHGRWHAAAVAVLGSTGMGDHVNNGVRIVPPSTSSSPDDDMCEESDGLSQTDFEGDEVTPALATYGIDRDGNLFEVHSPHTEVPQLPEPTI